jgi:hypothetical protein
LHIHRIREEEEEQQWVSVREISSKRKRLIERTFSPPPILIHSSKPTIGSSKDEEERS